MSDERPFRRPSWAAAHAVQRDHALLTDGAFTRALLANSGEAIKVLDLAGRIEFISDGALRALAIGDADALIGTSWAALWDNEAQASDAVARAKDGAAGAFEGERLAADGRPGWWEATVSPILDAGGQPAPLAAALEAAGFRPTPRGLRLRAS